MRRGFGDGRLQLPTAPTTDISFLIVDIATTSAILVWLSQGPPPSGQQAFLGQWSLPNSMLACAARLESPVVRVKRRRTSIFLPMKASCHGQRCAAVTGLHLIQTLHTAEVTLPISQHLH